MNESWLSNEWGWAMAGARSSAIRFCCSGPNSGSASKKVRSSLTTRAYAVSWRRSASSNSSWNGEQAGLTFASQSSSSSSRTIWRFGMPSVCPAS